MPARPGQDPKLVFLNVPYDAEYQLFFVTLVATLVSPAGPDASLRA